MRITGDEMWTVLRRLDDPDHLEWPADFDFAATRARFERLVSGLDAAFGCRCDADRSVQDASLHAQVAIPAGATVTGERLVVCVSNFGSLATVSVVNPGVFDEEEHEALLDAEDARRIHDVLDDLGYVVVPEAPLWQTYDGPSRITVDPSYPASWWTRYFDYL
ncbi:hypothetical protein [Microlunatus antarcticus]|uniref:Uncharacterized protein n=1 Tax=Microlunatus antarcticus TaxID=53388 RepID=A0A7W5P5J2_9ACTN|nr:hypothetical protein [Microlunatus antarcticus]MBB3325433.1 hypothetical protein [Microlunatus antarcticus]